MKTTHHVNKGCGFKEGGEAEEVMSQKHVLGTLDTERAEEERWRLGQRQKVQDGTRGTGRTARGAQGGQHAEHREGAPPAGCEDSTQSTGKGLHAGCGPRGWALPADLDDPPSGRLAP